MRRSVTARLLGLSLLVALILSTLAARRVRAGDAAPPAPATSTWSPRWSLRLEPLSGLGNYKPGGYWKDLTLAGLSGGVRSGVLAAEAGGRVLVSVGYDLFVRLGVSPTVVQGQAWSLALPVLAELRYTWLTGVDYPTSHEIWALLVGAEVARRWQTMGAGARLLVGRSGESASHLDGQPWQSTPLRLERTEIRLDFALHFYSAL